MNNYILLNFDDAGTYPYKKIVEEYTYSNSPISKMKFGNFLQPDDNNNKIKYEYIKKQEINSHGYRCENFTKNHNGKHILFSGCSHTFGDGLLYNEVWSKRLYDKINSIEKCSGYFNLAIPGSSFLNQVTDLFKYFQNFGNPDIIFINLTYLNRMFVYDKNIKTVFDGVYPDKYLKILKILTYQYYFMLNQYCNSNNIKLYTFPCIPESKYFDVFIKNFDTYYEYNVENLLEYIKTYKKNNLNDDYCEKGRDGVHFGNSYHSYWADFIYSIYIQE